MDFSYSEEQTLLQDTTRRFISREYAFEARRAIVAGERGMNPAVWTTLAELGLLALLVPEADGGLGAGPVETHIVMAALGEGLVVEPVLSSAVRATAAIARLGDATQRAQWLAPMAAGELIAVLAEDEAGVHAARAGDGYVLTGEVACVADAPHAGLLLVAAAVEGEGRALFALPADAPGLSMQAYPTFDGRRAADLRLAGVHVSATRRLGTGDVGGVLDAVADLGLAALCAEAIGVLDRALAITTEYARTRQQFGVAIGTFQALQHRMADMFMHLEQARSMAILATVRALDEEASARRRALSAAKVVIGEACRFVGQQAVQIHGGMGVTDELDISHYFKRLFAIEKQFGSTREHLGRYVALRAAA